MSYEIIDFHMHPFFEKADDFNFHKEVVDFTVSDIKNELGKAGITKFCGSIIKQKGDSFASFHKSNEEALKLRDMYEGSYIPGFQISPDYVEESLEEIDYAHENGVKLIGELVPYIHGWDDYSNERFGVLLDRIARYNMVVSLHTINLEQMETMAKNHPDVTFVFAHPGEKNIALGHIDVMKKCGNVYLDISGTGIFRLGVLKRLVSDVGADRILFGTDFPICNPHCYVAGVMGEDISDSERQLIFSGNAKMILGL